MTVIASVLVLATIVAGGLVAGTEGEGSRQSPCWAPTPPAASSSRPASASFMPFGEGRLVDIQLTHRVFMYLAAIAVLAMTAIALRQGVRDRAFWLASLLLACPDPASASLNVWLGEHAGLIVGHLMLGTPSGARC